MQKFTDEMIGDNLEGEVAPFSFNMPTGGEEIRDSSYVCTESYSKDYSNSAAWMNMIGNV